MSENQSQNIPEFSPSALNEKPSYAEAMLDFMYDPAEQAARDGVMRMAGSSAAATAGAMMVMEGPGLAGKAVGGALMARGFLETWAAKQAYEGKENRGTPVFMKMRDRIAEFGRVLIDKSAGKWSFKNEVRRHIGEELAATGDSAYRNAFSRMTGGMAMMAAGVEFMNQPGMAPKIVSASLMALGLHEAHRQGMKANIRAAVMSRTDSQE